MKNKLALSLFAVALLLSAPVVASASTVSASTGQTQTLTFGTVHSSTATTQFQDGTQYQVAVSRSSTGPQTCVNACVGSTNTFTGAYTKTNFSSQSTAIQTFDGYQNSNSITCYASASADPFGN